MRSDHQIDVRDCDLDVQVADGRWVKANKVGDHPLQLENGNRTLLKDVYIVPELSKNLISVNKMLAQGITVTFDSTGARIHKQNDTATILGSATWHDGLCGLDGKTIESAAVHMAKKSSDTLME